MPKYKLTFFTFCGYCNRLCGGFHRLHKWRGGAMIKREKQLLGKFLHNGATRNEWLAALKSSCFKVNKLLFQTFSLSFNIRSSYQTCSLKKYVLKNFTKFKEKHLSRRIKNLRHRCFPVNFARFSRTPFSRNTSGRLLL